MTQDLLAELHARRKEMQARLDEVNRLIELVTPKAPPRPRRRRAKTTTVGDILEPEILHALLTQLHLPTGEIALLLPGKRPGPMVSAWKRRAQSAGLVFDNLVERTSTPDGQAAFSLTDEGRRVFGEVAAATAEAAETDNPS